MKTETKKSKYQRYESYKDSGVEWLGEIPSEWDAVRLKYIANLYTGNSLKDSEKEKYSVEQDGLPYLNSKDIEAKTHKVSFENDCVIPFDKVNEFKIAKPHTLLLCIEGGSAGKKMGFLDRETCFVNKLCCFDPSNDISSKFIFYFNQTTLFQLQFKENMTGLIGGVSTQQLRRFLYILPTETDQNFIVAYLDRKITLINQIIEKKKQLIKLLKEKCNALINKAITKGLDKNVEFIDSGVEWIGKIPKKWTVKKLKYLTKINENTLSENHKPNQEIQYVDIGNVNIEGLINPPEQLLFKDAPSRARRIIKDGDVIIGTVRTYLKAIAHFDQAQENLIASTGFAVLTASQEINSKYLYFFATSEFFVSQVVSRSYGVSYPAITPTILGCLPILIPSDSEQTETLSYLIDRNRRITNTINRVLQSIDLLEEYKQSLITKVVKGEIKI